MITARNYAAQAQCGLERFASRMQADGRHDDAFAARAVAACIGEAIHFAIPDGGKLLSDDCRGIRGCPVRLPYPVMTIEYFVPESQESRKRVVLAVEDGERIVVRLAALFKGEWVVGPAGLSFGAGDKTEWAGDRLSIQREVCLPHVLERVDIDDERLYADLPDVLYTVLGTVEALLCKNVSSEPIECIDPSINLRRARARKLPIYETRRLIITVPDTSAAKQDRGGTHESPRQHLRRGHIRRLPSGNYWVNACVVGSADRGFIEKRYEVTT